LIKQFARTAAVPGRKSEVDKVASRRWRQVA
jgi:hypothetical protein